ncbi:hypothetical protein ADIMK_0576 [Marinobacterium lacunae]|uniref:Uncharacterized protein n=1 Tax=Marinobacterium lacunae TaxID=1232683 RepID=A0A081G399_9GAMM|nr:hypothetical protein ADIMK_0576 [Marinobacterium lacunae]
MGLRAPVFRTFQGYLCFEVSMHVSNVFHFRLGGRIKSKI